MVTCYMHIPCHAVAGNVPTHRDEVPFFPFPGSALTEAVADLDPPFYMSHVAREG